MGGTNQNIAKMMLVTVGILAGQYLAVNGIVQCIRHNWIPWVLLLIIGMALFVTLVVIHRNWFLNWSNPLYNVLFCGILLVIIALTAINAVAPMDFFGGINHKINAFLGI